MNEPTLLDEICEARRDVGEHFGICLLALGHQGPHYDDRGGVTLQWADAGRLTPADLGLPNDAIVTDHGDYYRTDWNAKQYTVESRSTGETYNVIVQLEG